jgi:hypothetical protein
LLPGRRCSRGWRPLSGRCSSRGSQRRWRSWWGCELRESVVKGWKGGWLPPLCASSAIGTSAVGFGGVGCCLIAASVMR